MNIRKIVLKAHDGKSAIVCQASVFLKDKNIFFYGKTDSEILSIDVPGWFKDAIGELNWEYIKKKINEKASIIDNGENGMELIINY
jgi:hypothetical protein